MSVMATTATNSLFAKLVQFVVITGFLSFTVILFFLIFVLFDRLNWDIIYLNLMNQSFCGLSNIIIVVFLAPFSKKLYYACCFIIHKRCLKCLQIK